MTLGSSDRALVEVHDLAMLDLDGVVYVGPDVVPGAAEAIAAWRAADGRIAFITNNASRPPTAVVDLLRELGVAATVDDVVTSAQAVARVVAERLGPRPVVVALGGEGLLTALGTAGVEVVEPGDPAARAVVTGYGPGVVWADLMRAAVAVRDGLPWFASNTDMTIPTAYGTAPGHGVQVEMIARFAGVQPVVAGKPERPLLEETLRRLPSRRPLMVGDRVDTDIRGGIAVGVDTLLVMTGVTGVAELVAIPPEDRPTYVAADLGGLLAPQTAVEDVEDGARAAGWSGRVVDGRLAMTGEGALDDWWRAVAVAGWDHLDRHGSVVDVAGLVPPTTPTR